MKESLSKGLTGIAGEYYAAAELSVQGYMAAVTLRNNESIDILAYRQADSKQFAIQVKTVQHGSPKWPLNKKAESDFKDNKFYIFVHLKSELTRPDFYIVPSQQLAENVKNNHKNWLAELGRQGQAHNDNDLRVFKDDVDKYKERWDLID